MTIPPMTQTSQDQIKVIKHVSMLQMIGCFADTRRFQKIVLDAKTVWLAPDYMFLLCDVDHDLQLAQIFLQVYTNFFLFFTKLR